MRQTGFEYTGEVQVIGHRWKQSGTGQTITGQEAQGNRGHERRGLQNKTGNKTPKLKILTLLYW